MIDISKLTYKVYILSETGEQLNVTDITESLDWGEDRGELGMKLSLGLANTTHNGKRISSIAKPNCYIIVTAEAESSADEVARVKIAEWEPVRGGEEDSVSLGGYDELHDLQESQDNRYIEAGTSTRDAIMSIFNEWGVPVGSYEGPANANAKTTYKNDYLADIILDLLATAREHGEEDCIIRASKGKVSVLPKLKNDPVYVFEEALNLETTRYRISTSEMVTVVKIVATEGSDGRQKVEDTVSGKTEYGRRQRILVRDKEDTLAIATAAAKKILEEDGKPTESFSVRAPDVPYIRLGDKVKVVTRVYKGFAEVLSVSHDATNRSMTLELEPLNRGTAETSTE